MDTNKGLHDICFKREGVFYCSNCGLWTPQLDQKSLTQTYADLKHILCENRKPFLDQFGEEYSFYDLHQVDKDKLISKKYINNNMHAIWLMEVKRHLNNIKRTSKHA